MDVKKYLGNKQSIRILSMIDNKDIIDSFDLDSYPIIPSLDDYKKNLFTDNELVVIIIDHNFISKNEIFKNNFGLQNVMLLVANDDLLNKNMTKYTNILFSYGYKYFGLSENDEAQVFIYDISEYKDNPDWLNNKNWANPELWEK
tara:strand:+ start:4663 stop:5097 length:435 start_codon:yes stop_codon:yes gene_type:complete